MEITVSQEEPQHQAPGWKTFLAHVGPGFLVSLTYLDPENLETDLQAGANHIYGDTNRPDLCTYHPHPVIISKSGVNTGKHLSELCKEEYPTFVKYCLWLVAKLAVIAADIPEVIGTAFALNILFHVPVWAGVLLTGLLSTMILLGLQRYGLYISILKYSRNVCLLFALIIQSLSTNLGVTTGKHLAELCKEEFRIKSLHLSEFSAERSVEAHTVLETETTAMLMSNATNNMNPLSSKKYLHAS